MKEKKQHLLTEKIKSLYNNSLIPAILSGINALFLVAALWHSADHQSLIIWLSITVLLAIVRVSLLISFKHKNPVGKQILKWEMPFSISLFSVFLTWSIGVLMVIPRDDVFSIFIASIFSVGLAAAAVSWYSHIRYIQLGTICLALLPIITVLLIHGTPETLWIGIAGCFMFISCISTGHIFQKTLNGNLELAYDLELSIKNAEVMARTDVLTGLNNRRAFFDTAPKLLKQCHKKELPASIIMFDVDYFKKINDKFGHAGGDFALQHVAELLKRKLRRSDIRCRFGGEEFAILLPNTSLEEANATAEKLRELIASTPIVYSRKEIPITASFGVANIGETIDEVLNNADHAMYRAKNNGRNLVHSYSSKLATVIDKKRSNLKSDKSTKVRDSLQPS
ncbi:MAG: GGDEF domain-containing protein [Methylophilaceae bacterium]